MSQSLAGSLFQSRTRTAVLDLLLRQGLTASASELARRAGLTPRSVATEVRNLSAVGLVTVQAIGGADLIKPNLLHPAVPHILGLLRTPARPAAPVPRVAAQLRESLAAWGAPLAGTRADAHLRVEETLLSGLEAARNDGTVLRVLPVVLAENLDRLEWPVLKEGARSRKLKAELGMLVELTGDLLGKPELRGRVADLHDRRRRIARFLPLARSEFERKLAKARTPSAARRWGFWMNMTEESFRSTLERHRAS